MEGRNLTLMFVVGMFGYYMGGGFDSLDVVETTRDLVHQEVKIIERPYLPGECKQAFFSSDRYDVAYRELVDVCFEKVGVEDARVNREVAVTNAYNTYQADSKAENDYTEQQIEEAFDECESDNPGEAYCEENLDEYLP